VVVRTFAAEDEVGVEIEDDGPGIPAAVRHRVFDPFFTTKDIGMGTGLGLSVSYGIVQEHRGRIELRPERAGAGACFVVTLPRAEGSAVASEAPEQPAREGKPLLGRRVLVAEDEPLVLDLFSRLLEADGAEVTLAHDGEEAWSRILETDFDLIVADLRMPNLDGRALYERVVEEKPEMVRRFVFATGDLVRQESLVFLEGLPNRILAKPLDVDDVRRVLVQVVSQTRFAAADEPRPVARAAQG
jgi:CheY-like chemotaxis protein